MERWKSRGGKSQGGEVRSQEVRSSEKRKSEKQEDAGARKGGKMWEVTIHFFFFA